MFEEEDRSVLEGTESLQSIPPIPSMTVGERSSTDPSNEGRDFLVTL